MQASQRARELERVYQSRRGHAPQISISDDNHHVTEAIGDMYGRDEYSAHQSKPPRPLSFVPSPIGETIETNPLYLSGPLLTRTPSNEERSHIFSDERMPTNMSASPKQNGSRSPSIGHGGSPPRMNKSNSPISPSDLHRSPSDTATSQFPLNDIDYESSPAAVAQELSNLQAIRRMSMDVNSMDPDLPTFGAKFGVPSVAPSPNADDEDPSRLFWVPARLHPELAPKEFKTFIQDRVKTIKRSSLGDDSLSPSSSSSGSLRRRKSMLSRQIEDGSGYEDGAEFLGRKLSWREEQQDVGVNLHDLETLVNDPSSLARRMSIDTAHSSLESGMPGSELPPTEDMPILPPKPAGQTLKRSTRTNYRRGSLKKGERVAGSRRAFLRSGEQDGEGLAAALPINGDNDAPPLPEMHDPRTFSLARVQTEPIPQTQKPVENFSRPGRRARTPPVQHQSFQPEEATPPPSVSPPPIVIEDLSQPQQPPSQFHSRIATNGRTTANLPGISTYIPTKVEKQALPDIPPHSQPLPQRSSSIEQRPTPPQSGPPPNRPQQRLVRQSSLQQQPSEHPVVDRPLSERPVVRPSTLDEMAHNPSPLPGAGIRTDSLSIIPTYTEERKDKKTKDKKEEGSKKSGWAWFSSSSEEKEREKRDKDEKETKRKARLQKPGMVTTEKPTHDSARLDVLQTSIDGPKGRESLVLDRASMQLEVEPERKTSQRKASGDKKEKESGLFSSLFGGSKKKSGEKDSNSKKSSSHRGLSPDPPPRILRPDIDYNWSRFSILEERAIYRMAHIKLANPRRELYSQVLLSNFMYSYLAKVQQMHPQMQIQTGPVPSNQPQKTGPQGTPPNQKQGTLGKKERTEELNVYQRYQEQQARLDSSPSPTPPNQYSAPLINSATNAPSFNELSNNLSQEPPSDDHDILPGRPDSRASQYTQSSGYSNTNGAGSYGHGMTNGGPAYLNSQNQQQNFFAFDEEEPAKGEMGMW